MQAGWGGRFEQSARGFLPFATTFVCVLVGVVVWPLPYIGPVTPDLALIAVYYWAVHRPDLLRPFGLFILGLLHDILSFYPVGLSAFVFVGLYQVVLSQRRFFAQQAFPMLWFGFALVMFMVSLVNWIALSLFDGHALPGLSVFLQDLMTLAIFPVAARGLIWVQRRFLTQG